MTISGPNYVARRCAESAGVGRGDFVHGMAAVPWADEGDFAAGTAGHSAGAASSWVGTGAMASNTPSRLTSAWNSAAATCSRIRAKNAKAR